MAGAAAVVVHEVLTRPIVLPEQVVATCQQVQAEVLVMRQGQDSQKELDGLLVEGMRKAVAALFESIDPGCSYLKATDANHARDVHRWLLRLRPHADAGLQMAALVHDVERYMPALKAKPLPDASQDVLIRKQCVHGLNSARVARLLMETMGAPEAMRRDVEQIVTYHDRVDLTSDVRLDDGSVLLPAAISVLHPDRVEDLKVFASADSLAVLWGHTDLLVEYFRGRNNDNTYIHARLLQLLNRVLIPAEAARVIQSLPQHYQLLRPDIAELLSKAIQNCPRLQGLSAGADPQDACVLIQSK